MHILAWYENTLLPDSVMTFTNFPVEVRNAVAILETQPDAALHAAHSVGVHGVVLQDIFVDETTASLSYTQSVER